ncbi:sodium transport system permease protein [Anaerosolibacter carboniphilus]|uniref:Sodium transport system permease protein n=1 Tax=Anaerosolibacter carboniphilus TaxID=1417629 RepID=A0A841L063_9FIRM|nr:ABC transporter permease [Anaerosolibacter carboniphilus]MBB6215775.1 sodium transport system permease protein [Anaerosolibacter carboniphilus]
MNWKHVKIVLEKEIKGLFRDKRTWIASILIPTLLFPILFNLMGTGMNRVEKSVNAGIKIAVEAPADGKNVIKVLNEDPIIEIVEEENPSEALEKGRIKAIVKIGKNFDQKLRNGEQGDITINYDESSTESSFALPKIKEVLDSYGNQIVAQRLSAYGMDPTILTPIELKEKTITKEESGPGLFILSFLLPLLLVLYPIIGGMPVSIDLAAGEKERQSLEPLLSTGASRLSILIGKYVTVTFASVLGVVASLTGLIIASKTSPEMLPTNITISVPGILIMACVSIMIAMIVSAILLVISIFARSYKEATTYMSPLTIVLMVPAYLTMFSDIKTTSDVMFFIPILNAVLLIKEALFLINPIHIAITFVVTGVMIVGAILFAKYMFEQEWVIFRS